MTGLTNQSHTDIWEKHLGEYMLQWQQQAALNYAFVSVMCLLAIVGPLTNIIVIVSLVLIPELHQIEYAFVGNLALADLVVTAIIIPINIAVTLNGPELLHRHPWLCELDGTICASACVGSMWCIAAIALERYICICYYSVYRWLFTPLRVGIMIIFLWIIGHTIHLPVFLGWGETIYADDLHLCTADVGVWSYSLFYMLVAILTPIFISFFAYVQIYLRIRKSRAGRRALTGAKTRGAMSVAVVTKVPTGRNSFGSESLGNDEKEAKAELKAKQMDSFKEELRLLKALFKVFLIFLGSWIWIATFALARNWFVFPKWYGYLALILAHGSSATNSMTYFWMTNLLRTTKEGYVRLFRRLRNRSHMRPRIHSMMKNDVSRASAKRNSTQIPRLSSGAFPSSIK